MKHEKFVHSLIQINFLDRKTHLTAGTSGDKGSQCLATFLFYCLATHLTQYARRVQKALTLFILYFVLLDTEKGIAGRSAIKQFRLLSRLAIIYVHTILHCRDNNYSRKPAVKAFSKLMARMCWWSGGVSKATLRGSGEHARDAAAFKRQSTTSCNKMIFLAFFAHEH
jgi:hypothetical protein